jgi:hypothetical protein
MSTISKEVWSYLKRTINGTVMGWNSRSTLFTRGAVCQGVWKQVAPNGAKLFHVIWTFDANGVLAGHIEETQTNTVTRDGNTYEGTFDQKFYDLNGNFTGEATGTLTATRLSVD